MLKRFNNNIGTPVSDKPYLGEARRGVPNIVFHEAALSPWHRFTVNSPGSSASTLSISSGFADDDYYDLTYFYEYVQDIFKAGTGTRDILTLSNLVDYLQQCSELSGMVQSLLGMKMIYDLDWEATFNEARPRELSLLADRFKLNGSAFDDTYGDVLRGIASIKVPATLVQTSTLFHSPFTCLGDNAIHQFNQEAGNWVNIDTDAGGVKSDLNNLFNVLKSVEIYARASSVFHNYFPNVPLIMEPQLQVSSNVHLTGLLNSAWGPSSQSAATSIHETINRPVAMPGAYFTTAGTWGSTASDLEYQYFQNGTLDIMKVHSYNMDTNPGSYIFCPFYEFNGTSGPTGSERLCYNHGVVNYGDHYTVDAAGNYAQAFNTAIYGGPSTLDNAHATDLLTFLDSVKADCVVNDYLLSIGGVGREHIFPKGVQQILVTRDSVKGVMFESLLDQYMSSMDLNRLHAVTAQAGVRTKSSGV